METPYRLPNGLTLLVVDATTAGGRLGYAVQSWLEGATEPLVFGTDGRPNGVAISFGHWAAYESIGHETRFERRVSGIAADQLATAQGDAGEQISEKVCKLVNGLSVRVIDTAVAGEVLGAAMRLWREGERAPLFYGAGAEPEGVVLSFDRWAEYEAIRPDAGYDGRVDAAADRYHAPNGDVLYVVDTVTVARNVDRILELLRVDGSAPIFFADEMGTRPQGVIISFRAWIEYEIEREDAEEERRREEVFRRLEAQDPSRKVTYEEAAREGGWDPVVRSGRPDIEGDHRRRLQAAIDAEITDGNYPLPNGATLRVADIGTVSQRLGEIVERFRSESTGQVFFTGDRHQPEGVVISFDQWAEYEVVKEEAEFDRRVYDITRERLANDDPSKWVTFEEMMEEFGLDPDSDELFPKRLDRNDESGNR
ncbi:hypothetical protein ACQHIV_15500 [Kribbella sp. GL6]|uniref:hypothetical protein n=1 Tax=Kribbella sp. GL6 TaxID=3419765 RepID=UPI003D012BCA